VGTGELLEIKKLQHNLSSLRKLAGWTAEDLGRKVGVTKQTVSNLENCRTSMSKIQYIAIRTILDYEARSNQNLARALHLVLDDRDATIEEHKANEDKVKAVATATAAGVSSTAIAALLGAASFVLGAWLAAIMDDNN
jgi:transcriptional regulator with XRE-family HTH domain